MRYASVLYRDYAENVLFTPGAGENNGEFYLPYAKLRERFLAEGIELNTPDVNAGRPVEYEPISTAVGRILRPVPTSTSTRTR
jgi:hypothetical protein